MDKVKNEVQELLNKVIKYMEDHDELPSVSNEKIKFAFNQYISHNSIDEESAQLIEHYNECGMNALDYCEYILTQVNEVLGDAPGYEVYDDSESTAEDIMNTLNVSSSFVTRILLADMDINESDEIDGEVFGCSELSLDELVIILKKREIPFDLILEDNNTKKMTKTVFRPKQNLDKKFDINNSGKAVIMVDFLRKLITNDEMSAVEIRNILNNIVPENIISLSDLEPVYVSEHYDLDDFTERLEQEIGYYGDNIMFDIGSYVEVYINHDDVDSESSDGYSSFRYIDELLTFAEIVGLFKDGNIHDDTMTVNLIPNTDEAYFQEREWATPISEDITRYINNLTI